MRKTIVIAIVFAAMCLNAGVSRAQSGKSEQPTISSVLERQLSGSEKEFTDAAKVMPADKYDFAPTDGNFKGVRTFGAQVRHLASYNFLLYSAILGEKPPAGSSGEGPESVKTKEQILAYLQQSFELGHRALATINNDNAMAVIPVPVGRFNTRLALAIFAVVHQNDHLGQMVEYLRMNGIVPPNTAAAESRANGSK